MGSPVGTGLAGKLSSDTFIDFIDDSRFALHAHGTGTPPTTASIFQHGCVYVKTDSGSGVKARYENTGTTAVPVWNVIGDIGQAELEEGSVVFVDVQLTNAEVLALRATPQTLIAAPGANKSLVVHKFHIVSDDSAGAWTESTDNLVIEYADGVDISAAIEAGTLVGGAVQVQVQGVLDTVLSPDVNAAVELFNTGDGEWGGGNVANSMSIRIWYSVVDTVAFT